MIKKILLAILIASSIQLSAQKQPVQKPTQAELDKWVAKAKKDTETAIGSSKDKPGFGYSNDAPEGTVLQLPAGVKIVKRKGHRFDPDVSKLAGGTVGAFFVDVSFVYCPPDSVKNNGPALVELPAGLILISEYQEGQNGLLVERVRINVPAPGIGPGGKDAVCSDTVTVYLAVACLNEHKQNFGVDKISIKEDNSDYTDAVGLYSVGKVTNDPNLMELLKIISSTPKLRFKKYPSRLSIIARDREDLQEKGIKPFIPSESDKIHSKIQEAIWKVTDRRGITYGELEELKKALAPFK